MTTFETESNKTLRAEDMNDAHIELLTAWADFEECEHIANKAIIKAYNAHKFKFATNAPTSGANMFDAMPYTSTSDYAAAWWCNGTCYNNLCPAWHFVGVALAYTNDYTQPRAVFIWRIFNDDGEEVRTVYEVAAADYVAALYGDIDEIKNARAEVGAAITETKKALDRDRTGAQWDTLCPRLDLLKTRAAFLKNNERQAVARLGAVALADVLTRYAGKRCGAATSQKIRDDFKKTTGARLVCSWGTGWNSCHVSIVRVQKVSPEGYITANGEAVELIQKTPDGRADFVGSDNVIIAPLGDIVPVCLIPPTAWTADEADALQELQKKAEQAIQDARALVREYNNRAPDGIDELRANI